MPTTRLSWTCRKTELIFPTAAEALKHGPPGFLDTTVQNSHERSCVAQARAAPVPEPREPDYRTCPHRSELRSLSQRNSIPALARHLLMSRLLRRPPGRVTRLSRSRT